MPDNRPYIEIEFTGEALEQYQSNTLIGSDIAIDYGDGNTTIYNGDYSHTYSVSGTYTIRIYGVTSLEKFCFRDCYNLTNIVIPDSVTSLGDYCFWDCSGLTSVVISESVTSLGYGCFNGCSGLTSVVIPESVTSLGDSCFRNCSDLTSVVIPNSIISIGNTCFYSCYNLTSVVIPDSVIGLGEACFGKCYSLTSIIVANSVTILGEGCFYDCTNLINVQLNWTSLTDIPTYNSSWIARTDSSLVFTIPQGTTSLYEAKGYPVAQLIEEAPEESLPYQPLDIKGQGIISLKIKGREVENIIRISDGITLYQKHKPETKNIKTSIIFLDNDNADLNRPDSVTINLFQNGMLCDSAVVDATTEWTHVFDDLPISENDEEIEYSINTGEAIMWYVAQIINFTITLIYQPEEENLTINKVWHDADNSLRPTELLVELRRNGTSIESVQLSEYNGWTETISVPTYYNNEVAEYSWVEEEIEGYLLESSLKDGNRTILTNGPLRPDIPPGPKK